MLCLLSSLVRLVAARELSQPPPRLVESISTSPDYSDRRSLPPEGYDPRFSAPPNDRPIGPKDGARLQPFSPTGFGWASSHPDSAAWGTLRKPKPVALGSRSTNQRAGGTLGAGPIAPGPGSRGPSASADEEDRKNEGRMYPPPWWEVRPWWLNSLPWWLATPRSSGGLGGDAVARNRRKDIVASLNGHPYDTPSIIDVPELPTVGSPLKPTGVLGGPPAGQDGDTIDDGRHNFGEKPAQQLYGGGETGREFGVGGPAHGSIAAALATKRQLDCASLEQTQHGSDHAPHPDDVLAKPVGGKGGKLGLVGGGASDCQKERGDGFTRLHTAGTHARYHDSPHDSVPPDRSEGDKSER